MDSILIQAILYNNREYSLFNKKLFMNQKQSPDYLITILTFLSLKTEKKYMKNRYYKNYHKII